MTNIEYITDVGLVRTQNEDSYRVVLNTQGAQLLLVADGMGGHNAGEVASALTCVIIETAFKNLAASADYKDFIKNVIISANQEIYKQSLLNPEYSKMGTTVSLAIIVGNKMYTGHVGDSRIYYLDNERIIQITKDHTLVQSMVDTGSLSLDQARVSKYKNVILQALGTSKKLMIEIKEVKLPKEYKILLCSDGLTGPVDDANIKNVLDSNDGLLNKLKTLVNMANELDGSDNVTIITFERGTHGKTNYNS